MEERSDMETRIAVNTTEIKILKQELEQLRTDNRNDHIVLGEKIDKLTREVTQLVERGKVEKENDRTVLNIRMWLIALFMSIITSVVTWLIHK